MLRSIRFGLHDETSRRAKNKRIRSIIGSAKRLNVCCVRSAQYSAVFRNHLALVSPGVGVGAGCLSIQSFQDARAGVTETPFRLAIVADVSSASHPVGGLDARGGRYRR